MYRRIMVVQAKIGDTEKEYINVRLRQDFLYGGGITERILSDELSGSVLYGTNLVVLDISSNFPSKVSNLIKIEGEHIQLSFCLEGNSRLINNELAPSFYLEEGFVRVSFQENSSLEFQMEGANRTVNIILSRQGYLNLMKAEGWITEDPFFNNVLRREYLFFDKGYFLLNHTVKSVLVQILSQVHPASLAKYRETFIEMKLKELFYLLHIQFSEEITQKITFDTYTVDALNKAKAILNTRLAQPPSTRELARLVSLNEQKLKKGFKALFETTIYAYVFDLRMKEAAELVLDPTNSVNAIATDLGYKSTSHFIAAFKKHFGKTPKVQGRKL